MTIDGEEYTAYVIDTSENEEYTFDESIPFNVYSVDVSFSYTVDIDISSH